MASNKENAAVGDFSEERLNPDHMATGMYQERVLNDTKHGNLDIHKRNPDARALYFKGVHDVLECIDTWMKMGLDTETFASFMEQLHAQTADQQTGLAH